MRNNAILALTAVIILSPVRALADSCSNPRHCSYECHNGWAYDPDQWYLSCDGNVWESTGISCISSTDESRSYCTPPQENSSNTDNRDDGRP